MLATALLGSTLAFAQRDGVWESKKSGWLLLSGDQHNQVFQFADQYKQYQRGSQRRAFESRGDAAG
jgi:hypothetical protein